jgi:hypothetical protein
MVPESPALSVCTYARRAAASVLQIIAVESRIAADAERGSVSERPYVFVARLTWGVRLP